MAAGLTRHEPGYSLPRRTALARRYQASPAEIDAAVDELLRRHVLRRLPTGEIHRAGPAEYLVSLPGLPGLSSFIDPMDHAVSCAGVRVSRLRASADVADVLGLLPGDRVSVRRCFWTADGEPAATSATYVPDEHANLIAAPRAATSSGGQASEPSLTAALAGPEPPAAPGTGLLAGAVRIEFQPPPRSVARRLRLTSGEPAVLVTVRLDDSCRGTIALTVLALRADFFRVVLETASPGGPAPDAAGDSTAGVGQVSPWQPDAHRTFLETTP